jgi:hypothetical protein
MVIKQMSFELKKPVKVLLKKHRKNWLDFFFYGLDKIVGSGERNNFS